MDAVDSEMMGVAEMLAHERPNLTASMKRGGDLLVLSSMTVEPRFRGNRTGHAMLRAILGTVGRNTALVILEAAPLLDDDAPLEGSPEHVAAKKKLRGTGWTSGSGKPATTSTSRPPDAIPIGGTDTGGAYPAPVPQHGIGQPSIRWLRMREEAGRQRAPAIDPTTGHRSRAGPSERETSCLKPLHQNHTPACPSFGLTAWAALGSGPPRLFW
jgi:hypothetical protein